MRTRTFKALALVVVGALAFTLAACGGRSDDSGSGGGGGSSKNLTIAYIPWDEDIAVTNLWKKILEDKGYKVKMQQLEVSPTFDAVANGKADLFFDTWLPVTHAPQWKKYKDQVEDIGVWYDQATLNIAVPTYMKNVNSIGDLNKVSGEVNDTITGIESGAGLTRVTKEAIKKYNLKLKLQTSGTPAMLAALKKATDAKKPIVVTLWHPHWAYSAYPVKDLKDPKHAMGAAEKIHTIGRQGFSSDHKDVASMLKNFKMTDKQLGDLENQVLVKNKSNPEAGVAAWLKANPDFVNGLG